MTVGVRPDTAEPDRQSSPENVSSPTSELRRIDFTGAIWFAATIIATTVPLGGMLAAGWHPSDSIPVLAVVWWVGATAIVVGIASLVWAGCPVLGSSLEKADRQKSFCIRAGVVLYLGGTGAAIFALLINPGG
ncbi:hypothetical protein [Cryobacterium sp. M91]|uniref:hypothetical protein n=1 Tax=Cryobacterium sp. M91 TaxID=2048294 RepID=UPI000CE2DD3B|nr:hypothetical protein [Cryobacterium sp. M91]